MPASASAGHALNPPPRPALSGRPHHLNRHVSRLPSVSTRHRSCRKSRCRPDHLNPCLRHDPAGAKTPPPADGCRSAGARLSRRRPERTTVRRDLAGSGSHEDQIVMPGRAHRTPGTCDGPPPTTALASALGHGGVANPSKRSTQAARTNFSSRLLPRQEPTVSDSTLPRSPAIAVRAFRSAHLALLGIAQRLRPPRSPRASAPQILRSTSAPGRLL